MDANYWKPTTSFIGSRTLERRRKELRLGASMDTAHLDLVLVEPASSAKIVATRKTIPGIRFVHKILPILRKSSIYFDDFRNKFQMFRKTMKLTNLSLFFQSISPSPRPPSSSPVGPLSLTTRPEDQQPPISTPAVKREEARVSSGSEDDEASPTGSLPPGFSLVPSPMFGHGIMYMSPYLPPRGQPGCPTSMLDERRKRNRTFIDPVTEVPRLEDWFSHNTHPSHAVRNF